MNLAIWIIILVLLSAFALYAMRLAKTSKDDDQHDAGQAIIDFSRAYPGEAIRSLHMTADGNAVFVRLHDNKAGFMRNMGTHHACMLIDPTRIRVEHLETGDGFLVEFMDSPKYSGSYRFPSAGEAAEVSLWLLGSYVEATDELAPEPVEDDRAEGDQDATPSSPTTVS
jgi:hypothetical protein